MQKTSGNADNSVPAKNRRRASLALKRNIMSNKYKVLVHTRDQTVAQTVSGAKRVSSGSGGSAQSSCSESTISNYSAKDKNVVRTRQLSQYTCTNKRPNRSAPAVVSSSSASLFPPRVPVLWDSSFAALTAPGGDLNAGVYVEQAAEHLVQKMRYDPNLDLEATLDKLYQNSPYVYLK